MLRPLFLLPVFLAVFTVGVDAAAMVSCSQPGFSQTVYNGTCAMGNNLSDTLMFQASTGASIVNGAYLVQGWAEVLTTPNANNGAYPMSASASWDDFFALPESDAADIVKITVTGGGVNHAASITAGPISYVEANFCDAHYTGNPVCTQTATVSASSLSGIHLTGSDSITIGGPCGYSGCGVNANSDLSEFVTVQRFLSDGVTADPFTDPMTATPEPASAALLLLAIPGAFALRKWR